MLEGKRIVLGVTGGIAAYKAGEIVRGLQKAGVRVKVVMTEHGTHFVDPVTFRALTHEKVAVGLFDDPSDPIHHISLAQECDVFLIAPCTANVMAKVACGIADDLLSTTALATTATLAIAPAANVHMYEAAATQENMATLRRRGVRFIEGGAGYLACGDVGRGRLADPAVIVRETLGLLAERVGLDALREACEVDLYTDSKYVCDAVEKGWLAGWQKRHWVKSDKKPVLNVDLWKQLLPLLRTHKVTFHWLRGHAGHRENERCDELARAFAAGPDLPEDTGFTAAQA